MLNRMIYGAVAIGLLLAAGASAEPQYFEADDTAGGAGSIVMGSQMQAEIGHYKGDISTSYAAADVKDWWRLTVPSNGHLFVQATEPGTLADHIWLEFFDSTGTHMMTKAGDGNDNLDPDTFSLDLKPGSYMVTVNVAITGGVGQTSSRAVTADSGSYTLSSVFTPATLLSESENNDSAARASLLNVNDSANGNIGYLKTDSTDLIDWWKVVLPQDGRFQARVTPVSAILDQHIRMSLVTADGKNDFVSTEYSGIDTLSFFLAAGTYYLRVGAEIKGSSCSNRCETWSYAGSYRIWNSLAAAPGIADIKGNDSISVATAMTGDTAFGHIGFSDGIPSVDNVDWWKYVVMANGAHTFQLLGDSVLGHTARLFLMNSNGNEIASTNSGGPDTLIRDILAGTYYLKVQPNVESNWCGSVCFTRVTAAGSYRILVSGSLSGRLNRPVLAARSSRPSITVTGHRAAITIPAGDRGQLLVSRPDGRTIRHSILTGQGTSIFNLSGLGAGIVVIRIKTGNRELVRKIMLP